MRPISKLWPKKFLIFLRGQDDKIIDDLKEKDECGAQSMEFERAEYRDLIQLLNLLEPGLPGYGQGSPKLMSSVTMWIRVGCAFRYSLSAKVNY